MQPETYTQVLDAATATASRVGTTYAVVMGVDPQPGVPWDLVGQLQVSAASGTTPTLDVVIEGSADSALLSYAVAVTFPQVTVAPNSQRPAQTATMAPWIRAKATIGGTTPSFTYKVVLTSNKPFTLIAV